MCCLSLAVARFTPGRCLVHTGWLISAISLAMAGRSSAADSTAAGTFTNLGPQVTATTIQGSAFVRDGSGRDLVYTVVRGEPAHLLGYDVKTGGKILDVPLPGCDGSWSATVSSDGSLYLTSGNGHLFRHKPGTKTAEDLGPALPGETVMWDVTPGADGEVFGATYPGCRVFRYSPKDGFSDAGRGPLVKGENYVRCVAYDARSGKVYAGVGSHAHLIELDPKTGRKRELLAEHTAGQEAVYSLCVIPDEATGDRLLAWVTNRNRTLVYNLRTERLERELPTQAVKTAIKAPDRETVYYSDGTSLMAFDLDRPDAPPRTIARCTGSNATQWLDADHLCILSRYASVVTCDTKTHQTSSKALSIPPQPIPIQSVEFGPDGKVWMGGFLAGGTASFDPVKGTTTLYRGMSQIERMAVLGGEMYFGVYPHARLYRFDPRLPWTPENPRRIAQVEGQSRPIAMLGVPEVSKVFIGTVPEYGQLGGHLMEYDPSTDRLKDDGEVVARQSVVSLAFAGRLLLGGTSVSGGLGQEPAAKEARLFGWDPATGQAVFEITPVPDAAAITCLIVGPDRNVWGVADGTLFLFDPAARRVLGTYELVKTHRTDRHVWRDAFLVVHPSGQVYATLAGRFLRIDPETKKATILRESGVSLLAMDRQGRLYFRDTVNLWRYTP